MTFSRPTKNNTSSCIIEKCNCSNIVHPNHYDYDYAPPFLASNTASLAPIVPLPPPAEKANCETNPFARTSASSAVKEGQDLASAFARMISHFVERMLKRERVGWIGP